MAQIINGDIKSQVVIGLLVDTQGKDIATGAQVVAGDIKSQVEVSVAIDVDGDII